MSTAVGFSADAAPELLLGLLVRPESSREPINLLGVGERLASNETLLPASSPDGFTATVPRVWKELDGSRGTLVALSIGGVVPNGDGRKISSPCGLSELEEALRLARRTTGSGEEDFDGDSDWLDMVTAIDGAALLP